MSKPRKKGVDMSVPPEDRGRRRQQGPVGGTPAAQLGHARGSRAARWTRDGQRKLAAMEALHGSHEYEDLIQADRVPQTPVVLSMETSGSAAGPSAALPGPAT
jgi:hypothetical protein